MRKPDSDTPRPRPPVTAWLIFAFLAAFLLWSLLLPDRAFSAAENRMLAQPPACTAEKLFGRNADWAGEFEAYFSDQFALRDQWVAIKAGAEKLLGKKENNGVYFAADALIEKPDVHSDATARMHVQSVNTFAKATDAEVYLALIPNACCIERAQLPAYAYDGAQPHSIAACYAALEGVSPVGATLAVLQAHRGEGRLYYRTDHHPTTLGAYYIYTALGEALGFAPDPLDAFTCRIVTDAFSGTARAKSGAWWTPRDSIALFLPKTPVPCTLTTYSGEQAQSVQSGLYDMERLESADPYAVFLGGNHPRQVIQTGVQNARRLLIVKDSFAHCVTPFLARHYSEIHLLDLRYYRASAADYAREHAIDQVLTLYSVSNFMTDRNLLFLAQ